MLIKVFFFFFISCGHFDKRIEALVAISVDGHPRNISVKLF